MKSILSLLIVIFGVGLSINVQAIEREDVLECGLPDGSKFVLRSKYQWSSIPLPLRHSSRESKHQDWDPIYIDVAGVKSDPPAAVMYSGKGAGNYSSLSGVCSEFAMKEGVVLVNSSYLRTDNTWLPLEAYFKPDFLLIMGPNAPKLTPAIQQKVDRAGVRYAAFNFAYIFPKHGRLIFEQPLYRTINGNEYEMLIDAVYQTFSIDGGKTWSESIVTTKSNIFEIGKSRLQQSFSARPLSLNGVKVN